MSDSAKPGPSTLSVHGGEPDAKERQALLTPVFLTSSYVFDSTEELSATLAGSLEREEYGRYGNPTVRAAEHKLAALEGTDEAVLFPSGMAAVTTALLAMLKSGQHVVLTSDCYRRTRQFLEGAMAKFGVDSTVVPPGDLEALTAAIRPGKTRIVLTETPTNPYVRVVDIAAYAEVCRRFGGVKLMVDATLATPVNQRTYELGADVVIESATKYLGGHNDLLAGAVCGAAPLMGAVREFRGTLGPMLDPHTAFLLLRGMKTLELRVHRQNETALAIARLLERHEKVERVFYPGLESHPDFAIARRQMSGFGGVVSFLVRDGLGGGARFVDACRLAIHAPSLGGVETLVQQPAIMSYSEMTTEQRRAVGIDDGLVRLAVGIEDYDDVARDVEQALEAV
jgi:cystathionine gamma-synthase